MLASEERSKKRAEFDEMMRLKLAEKQLAKDLEEKEKL